VKTNLAAKVVITHQASGGSEKRSHRLGVTTEQAGEEGELIESQPDAEAESESYKDENLSTQQSSIMAGGTSNMEVDEDVNSWTMKMKMNHCRMNCQRWLSLRKMWRRGLLNF
jgi:hypothetical protein